MSEVELGGPERVHARHEALWHQQPTAIGGLIDGRANGKRIKSTRWSTGI